MSRVLALADLHLSLSGEKPMEVFGEAWRDHPRRMAEAWDRTVGPEDVVLLAGDLSWATTLVAAAPDLRWIGERPGRKVLLRGNHDYWWPSLSKLRQALPPGCEPLQNNAIPLDRCIVVGARGWIAPDDPTARPEDRKIFARELERLRLSVQDADARFGRSLPRVAMLHFPPWITGREPTAVVPLLRAAGVEACVYGHLHGDDLPLGKTGGGEGMRFHLVSADAVGFRPVEIKVGEPHED
jgi:hypothetical protein